MNTCALEMDCCASSFKKGIEDISDFLEWLMRLLGSGAIPKSTSSSSIETFIRFFITVPIVIWGGSFFARRNLRMGRGDRRGAARLACFSSALFAISWIFGTHHVAAPGEANLFYSRAGSWLFSLGIAWLMAILLALALYAFHTSLGRQPLFGRASLED